MILDQWISGGEPRLEFRIVHALAPELHARTLGHTGNDGWRKVNWGEYNFQGDLLARILELKDELRFYGVKR